MNKIQVNNLDYQSCLYCHRKFSTSNELSHHLILEHLDEVKSKLFLFQPYASKSSLFCLEKHPINVNSVVNEARSKNDHRERVPKMSIQNKEPTQSLSSNLHFNSNNLTAKSVSSSGDTNLFRNIQQSLEASDPSNSMNKKINISSKLAILNTTKDENHKKSNLFRPASLTSQSNQRLVDANSTNLSQELLSIKYTNGNSSMTKKFFEDRITKLISDNEKLLIDSEFEKVKPRRATRQDSNELPLDTVVPSLRTTSFKSYPFDNHTKKALINKVSNEIKETRVESNFPSLENNKNQTSRFFVCNECGGNNSSLPIGAFKYVQCCKCWKFYSNVMESTKLNKILIPETSIFTMQKFSPKKRFLNDPILNSSNSSALSTNNLLIRSLDQTITKSSAVSYDTSLLEKLNVYFSNESGVDVPRSNYKVLLHKLNLRNLQDIGGLLSPQENSRKRSFDQGKEIENVCNKVVKRSIFSSEKTQPIHSTSSTCSNVVSTNSSSRSYFPVSENISKHNNPASSELTLQTLMDNKHLSKQ